MDVVIIIILGLLVAGITMIVSSILEYKPRVYIEHDKNEKTAEVNTLDVQFGADNYPSKVHDDMFAKSSPWIGGYDIGNGKTYVVERNK